MNFPKYWVKGSAKATDRDGKPMEACCWRWSDRSLEEANQLAETAAQKLAERFAQEARFPDHYAYADRPLREEVLREMSGSSGDRAAVMTRNS